MLPPDNPKNYRAPVRAAEDTQQAHAEDAVDEMADHTDPPSTPLAGTDPETHPDTPTT